MITLEDDLVFPTIHLNGTSREELLRQTAKACAAITNAVAALHQAAPHGRDYYLQEGDAIRCAIEQHHRRLMALQRVFNELQIIGMHIADTQSR